MFLLSLAIQPEKRLDIMSNKKLTWESDGEGFSAIEASYAVYSLGYSWAYCTPRAEGHCDSPESGKVVCQLDYERACKVRKFTCYPRTAEDVPSTKEYNAFLDAFADIVGFEYAGDWEAFKNDPKNVERADFFAAGFKAASQAKNLA